MQPLLVYRAWEGEDLTFDKSDPKDAVIIAGLAAGCIVMSRSARTRCGRGCGTWVPAGCS